MIVFLSVLSTCSVDDDATPIFDVLEGFEGFVQISD